MAPVGESTRQLPNNTPPLMPSYGPSDPFSLRLYDPNAICDKCHNDEIKTDLLPADADCIHPRTPHFHRTCTRPGCRNDWGETAIEADVTKYDTSLNRKNWSPWKNSPT